MHEAVSVIAQIARTDPNALTPERTLGSLGLNKSLGLSVVRAALERKFQCKLASLRWQSTIADILAELAGAPVAPSTGFPAAAISPALSSRRVAPQARDENIGWGHGIDIQEIAVLPEFTVGSDLAPFYPEHFSAKELDSAKSHADPRAHLAGLWCAKEAVRKAHPSLAQIPFSAIVIGHDAAGRPNVTLPGGGPIHPWSILISISHSTAYAVASAIVRPSR